MSAQGRRGPRPPVLGLLESSGIARGIKAMDAALKEAPIAPLSSFLVEPGRHVFLFTGEVDPVRQAIRAGRALLGEALLDELFLANAHPALADALERASPVRRFEAAGLIECGRVATTLLAADRAAKEAPVSLVRVRITPGMGGKGLVALTGEVADVESAVAVGAALAEERDALLSALVITGPDPRLLDLLLEL